MGGAISWRSCLQEYTAMSNTEVEYVVASEACKEVVWISRIACDMCVSQHKSIYYTMATTNICLGKINLLEQL